MAQSHARVAEAPAPSPLAEAIRGAGDSARALRLLAQQPELARGRDPLYGPAAEWIALAFGRPGRWLAVLDCMLEGGMLADSVVDGGTPLITFLLQFERTRAATTRALLQHGVAGALARTDEWNPLYVAALLGDAPLAQLLVDGGAATAVRDSESGDTLLHAAAAAADGHAIDVVCRLGLDPNARNAAGQTALHCAAACGNAYAVDRLLGVRGVDVHLADPQGRRVTDEQHYALARHVRRRLLQQRLFVLLAACRRRRPALRLPPEIYALLDEEYT